LAGTGIVLDWALHALDRLLGAVTRLVLLGLGDVPDGRLLAVAGPVALGALLYGIPAGLMLPMVVAAREDQLALVPDDLAAELEAAGGKAIADHAGKQAGMPDIGDVAREQGPCFAPVRLVVVQHVALGRAAGSNACFLPPGRVIFHPVGRIGDHQMGRD